MTEVILPKGKKPARQDDRDILFSQLANPEGLAINVPTVFGHGNSFKDWGMLGNDNYGDCVWAGGDHETMLIDNLASGGATGFEAVKFTPENALADYESTGFRLNDPNTDQGTDVRQALGYRIKTGLVDSKGKRHKIAAYVALDPGNIKHLIEAIFIFDAVGIGFEFPSTAMAQYNEGKIWSVKKGANIEGGHYVPLVGKPAAGDLSCITWGRRQVLTEEFYKTYCDEAYAFVTQESLNVKTQRNWGGFNWRELQERLKVI